MERGRGPNKTCRPMRKPDTRPHGEANEVRSYEAHRWRSGGHGHSLARSDGGRGGGDVAACGGEILQLLNKGIVLSGICSYFSASSERNFVVARNKL